MNGGSNKMATPDKEQPIKVSEWKSDKYMGSVYGTADANFVENDKIQLKIKYSAYSVYRRGESHVFTLTLKRSISNVYGESSETIPQIWIAIPLDGSPGQYVTHGPDDFGTMVFDTSWTQQLTKRIPDTDAQRPAQMSATMQEPSCSIM